jgi:hypothetical protein
MRTLIAKKYANNESGRWIVICPGCHTQLNDTFENPYNMNYGHFSYTGQDNSQIDFIGEIRCKCSRHVITSGLALDTRTALVTYPTFAIPHIITMNGKDTNFTSLKQTQGFPQKNVGWKLRICRLRRMSFNILRSYMRQTNVTFT